MEATQIENKSKLDWSKFEPQFGTWARHIYPFFAEGGFDPIYARLKERSKQGKIITPYSADTFKAFRSTPYESLNCIVVGMCPYHTMWVDKDGVNKMVADGLCMSAGNHFNYKPPSLMNFYDALEGEFEKGMCLECDRPQSLQYLADQGVLLTNAQLTAEVGKPGIHEDLWRPFTRYMMEEVYSVTGVPVVFLGQAAGQFARYLNPMQWQFQISHPASAAYRQKKWDSEQVFTQINKIVYDMNHESISWLIPNPGKLS